MRIASIDIGTNTFRILVSEIKGTELKKIYIDRVVTRLGGGFNKTERLISDEAIDRALMTLRGYAEILEKYSVERVRAVATSVVRESINGNEFIKRVESESGIVIELISGEKEAELTVKGVLKSVSPTSNTNVVFDIGGGSTEYSYVDQGVIRAVSSTSLGVVHLAENFLKNDIPSELDIRAISQVVDSVLSQDLHWMSRLSREQLSLIGTAGTPTTLAAVVLGLNEYDPNIVNGFVLKRDTVLKIFQDIIKIPREKRLLISGIEKGREDVIIPGCVILLKTMEKFSKDKILVSDGGLLEGVTYSLVS